MVEEVRATVAERRCCGLFYKHLLSWASCDESKWCRLLACSLAGQEIFRSACDEKTIIIMNDLSLENMEIIMTQTDDSSNIQESSEMPKWLTQFLRRAVAGVVLLFLAGSIIYFWFVSPRMFGTYSTDDGNLKVEFHFNGSAVFTIGGTYDAKYEVHGDRIYVTYWNPGCACWNQESLVRRGDDISLYGMTLHHK